MKLSLFLSLIASISGIPNYMFPNDRERSLHKRDAQGSSVTAYPKVHDNVDYVDMPGVENNTGLRLGLGRSMGIPEEVVPMETLSMGRAMSIPSDEAMSSPGDALELNITTSEDDRRTNSYPKDTIEMYAEIRKYQDSLETNNSRNAQESESQDTLDMDVFGTNVTTNPKDALTRKRRSPHHDESQEEEEEEEEESEEEHEKESNPKQKEKTKKRIRNEKADEGQTKLDKERGMKTKENKSKSQGDSSDEESGEEDSEEGGIAKNTENEAIPSSVEDETPKNETDKEEKAADYNKGNSKQKNSARKTVDESVESLFDFHRRVALEIQKSLNDTSHRLEKLTRQKREVTRDDECPRDEVEEEIRRKRLLGLTKQ